MVGQRIERGATAATVGQNLQTFRKAQGLTYADVSRRLESIGRKGISALAVRRMEGAERKEGVDGKKDAERRVDVDDLVALALVLNVNPNALLFPNYVGKVDVSHEVTGVEEGTSGDDVWDWADGWAALPQTRTSPVGAAGDDADRSTLAAGRRLWKEQSAAVNRPFFDLVRPSGELSEERAFLARARAAIREHRAGEWLSLWVHGVGGKAQTFRLKAWPESGWSNINDFAARLKAEVAGILDSPDVSSVVPDVLSEQVPDANSD